MILPADIKVRSFLGEDAISFSEIGTLARCEQAWVYAYATEREDSQPSAAMVLGTDTHTLWGDWHMHGALSPEDTTAAWLMERYARYYKRDGVKCIDVEVPVVAKLPMGPYFFGFADALISYKRKLWVGELKTTQQLSNVDYLERTLQTPLYVWALRQMGVPVAGAMLDVIRSYKPVRKELPLEDSFARRWLPYTDGELVRSVARAMRAVHVRKELRGFGDMPYVPLANVGSACSWCSYAAPCFGLDVQIADESESL